MSRRHVAPRRHKACAATPDRFGSLAFEDGDEPAAAGVHRPVSAAVGTSITEVTLEDYPASRPTRTTAPPVTGTSLMNDPGGSPRNGSGDVANHTPVNVSGANGSAPSIEAADVPPAADTPHGASSQPDVAWYIRPWRKRLQPVDVAIAGLVVVIGLVAALALSLGAPKVAPGSRPLTDVGSSSGAPSPPSSSTGSPSSSTSPSPASRSAKSGSAVPIGSSALVTGTTPTTGSSTQVAPSTTGPAPTETTPAPGTTPAPSTTSPQPAQTPTSSPPPPCTLADLKITSTTDSTTYSAGSPITITTQVAATVACVFNPVASGAYSCPVTVVVSNGVGLQVYPAPGQGETCAPVSSGTLTPGTGRTVKVVLDPQNGGPAFAPGQYTATSTWSWGNQNSPTQASANSSPFTVGP